MSQLRCVIPPQLQEEFAIPLARFYRQMGIPARVVIDRRTPADPRFRLADRRGEFVRLPPPAIPPEARALAGQLIFLVHREHAPADPLGHAVAYRAKHGETAAFEELYLRYRSRVSAYLGAVLRDAYAAEDASQESFERVRALLPRYEPRPGVPLWAWVFKIVSLVAREELARRKRLEPWDPGLVADHGDRTASAPGPDDVLSAGRWAVEELAPLIAGLPRARAQAFLLVSVLDYGHDEAATLMGKSVDNVRQLKRRALADLNGALSAAPEGKGRRQRMSMWVRLRPLPVVNARRWALWRAPRR